MIHMSSRKLKIALNVYIVIVILLILISTAVYSTNILEKIGKYFFLEIHNVPLARFSLEQSAYINNKNPETYFLLGRIYFVQGDLKKSVEAYSQAKNIYPDNEQIYYGLGLTYGYMNDLNSAAKNFQKYLDIIEDKKLTGEYKQYPSGHWAGYNDLAWIYFLQGDYKKAEEVTKVALNKYNNPWLLNMMGSILLNQGRNREAKVYFERAKEYAKNLTWEDFGEAYSGDNKDWQEKGFSNMKQIIDENIAKSEKLST